MISHKYECIFVHVPKTAGMTIEREFLALHGLKWDERAPLLLRYNPHPSQGPERLAHLKATEYCELGYVDRDTFNRYFKFSFVRNPWSRLVSEYRYLDFEGKMPFPHFVEQAFASIDNYRNAARHIIPQVDYLTDEAGEFMVDFIGRYESLDSDFDHVARTLKLPPVRLMQRNVSGEGMLEKAYRRIFKRYPDWKTRRPYQEYYSDPALRELVARFYAEDIDRFGYRFDGSFAAEPLMPTRA